MANHRASGAHRAEHYHQKGLSLANMAIAHVSATGAKAMNYEQDGSFVRIERVAHGHNAGWRVTDSNVDGITGAVLVVAGLPGRYKSHAA